MAAPVVISPTTTITDNGGGSFTQKISSGAVFYKDDAGTWRDVDFTSAVKVGADYFYEKLPDNATRKVFGDHIGYRASKWIGDEEFWVECHGPVATLTSKDKALISYETPGGLVVQLPGTRTTLQRFTILPDKNVAWPAFQWKWSDNLTEMDNDPKVAYYWKNDKGERMFTMQLPRAWSQADTKLKDVRIGDATIDQDGVETLDIDLVGLVYPIIVDPTTAFAPTAGDGFIDSFKSATYADVDWPGYRAGSFSFDVQYGGTAGQWAEFIPGTELNRGFSAHDTSSLTGAATISAASFTAFCVNHFATDASTIDVVQGAQASVTQLTSADWATVGNTSGGSILCSALSNTANFTINFNATGIGFINKTGNTKLAFKIGLDFSDSTFPAGSGNTGTTIQFSEGANPPSLSITYTADATAATLSGISPNRGRPGQTIQVTIFGVFDGSETFVLSGTGFTTIALTGVTFNGALTQAFATVVIPLTALLGKRNLVATDGSSNVSTLPNAFTIGRDATRGGNRRKAGPSKMSISTMASRLDGMGF